MRRPYLVKTHFQDQILGKAASGWVWSIIFDFWKFISMGFPAKYHTTLLNDHRFLVILGWVRNWVWGRGSNFFWSENTFLRVSNYCVQCEGICLNILAKNVQQMNKWMDTFEILAQLWLRLVTCSLHWTRIQSSMLLVQHVSKNCWLLKIVIWNIFRLRVILAPFLAPDFWVSLEVTGTGQNFGSGWNWSKFWKWLKSPFHGFSNSIWHDHTKWTPFFTHFWAWMQVSCGVENVWGRSKFFYFLKYSFLWYLTWSYT